MLLYLESFGNPRKFGRVARRVARRKPILAMKAGTTAAGARAASSHTAALAGSDAAVDALFHQAGVLRARTLEELIDVAALLSSQPLPRGRRVAVLTNAGGLGILCADACEAAGLELPELDAGDARPRSRELLPARGERREPVDLLGSATAATYEQALPLLLADPRVDAADRALRPAGRRRRRRGRRTRSARAVEAARRRQAGARGRDQRRRDAGRAARVAASPASPTPSRPRARSAWPPSAPSGCAGRRARVPELDGIDQAAAPSRRRRRRSPTSSDVWLDPGAARELLERLRHPARPRAHAPRRVDEAVAAASELGFPVVVKTATAGAHKTETGGVALDLRDEPQVRAAVERIGAPVIVQPYLKGGVELLAGVVQDPVFGPLVAFGPGGVLAELIGDASFRIAPLTDVDAEELVTGGKAGRLVAGFRGAPACRRGGARRPRPPARAGSPTTSPRSPSSI